MPKVMAAGLSHPGVVRKRNEDGFFLFDRLTDGQSDGLCSSAVLADRKVQFYAVADGMGGKGIGDAAVSAALKTLDAVRVQFSQADRFDFPFFARHFLNRAGQAVLDVLGNSRGLYAGAAITLLCLTDEDAFVLSLGNCRCYRLRGQALTRLVAEDVLPGSEPRRLSRYLGQLPEESPEEPVGLYHFDLQKDDLFLMATDGFSDVVPEHVLIQSLATPGAFAEKPRALMDQALAGGALDNVTLLLVKVLDTMSEEEQAPSFREPIRHRNTAHRPIKSPVIRGMLIFLMFILTGFVAGWLFLTLLL